MNLKLVLGSIVLLAAVVFSFQNSGVVDVKFITWKFSTSLALIILGPLAAGFVGGWAVTSALRLKKAVTKS